MKFDSSFIYKNSLFWLVYWLITLVFYKAYSHPISISALEVLIFYVFTYSIAILSIISQRLAAPLCKKMGYNITRALPLLTLSLLFIFLCLIVFLWPPIKIALLEYHGYIYTKESHKRILEWGFINDALFALIFWFIFFNKHTQNDKKQYFLPILGLACATVFFNIFTLKVAASNNTYILQCGTVAALGTFIYIAIAAIARHFYLPSLNTQNKNPLWMIATLCSLLGLILLTVSIVEVFEFILHKTFLIKNHLSLLGSVSKPLNSVISEIHGVTRQGIHCFILLFLVLTLYSTPSKPIDLKAFNNIEFWKRNIGGWSLLGMTVFILDTWKFNHTTLTVQALMAIKTIVLGTFLSLAPYYAIQSSRYRYRLPTQSPIFFVSISIIAASTMVLLDRFIELCILYYSNTPNVSQLLSPENSKYFNQSLFSKWVIFATWFFSWASLNQSLHIQHRQAKLRYQLLKAEKDREISQLAYLNSQLDTHFIFNTLTGIRYLTTKKPDIAQSSISVFSQLLRFALDSSKSQKIPLGNEINFTLGYIKLCNLDVEKTIDYSLKHLAPNSALIPPMIMQMLAENAIKYGHWNSTSTLYIKTNIINQQLSLSIMNPGQLSLKPGTGCGIALNNIRERLNILYAEQGSVCIKQRFGHVLTTIKLPFENTLCAQ